jgi:hypothetical protein
MKQLGAFTLVLTLHGLAAAGPIVHTSVAEALAALKARDGNGTVVTESEGWVIVNEPAAAAQWSFTPTGHAAHPAVVRRIIRRPADGPPTVETETLCEAGAQACTALTHEFEAMNDRITQSVKARGRQGSTPPR